MISQRVLDELDAASTTPDNVQALARYAKDTMDGSEDAKTSSQKYCQKSASLEVALPALVVESASRVSSLSNISGVSLYVQQAIDKVVKELKEEMPPQGKLADEENNKALVVDALDECRSRLAAGRLKERVGYFQFQHVLTPLLIIS